MNSGGNPATSDSVSVNRSRESIGSFAASMENPFSLKFGQVFTGFGVGCGIGIGVGRPINLGAIPALQQVLTATRGATDILSGAGRHVNSSFRRFGVKGVEAGVGCGVGVGHGFGVGIAIRPGAIQRIQSYCGNMLMKIASRFGMESNMSSLQKFIPGPLQSNTNSLSESFYKTESTSSTKTSPGSNHGLIPESKFSSLDSKDPTERASSRSEKVIDNFLQSPLLQTDKRSELGQLAENLRSENDILHVLLKHQQMIDELVKENEKLHQMLREGLKISPTRLNGKSCSDCVDWRRKRKSAR